MYKLDDIVKEYLIEGGDTQLNKYARVYTIAVSGLREFNLDSTGIMKMADLPITDIDTVNLPIDFVKATRVAICGKDGLLHSLGTDNNICLGINYDDCGIPENKYSLNQQSGTSRDSQYFLGESHYMAEHIRNGEVMGRFFGIGGGNNTNGTYRFDFANWQIQLGRRQKHNHHITLEYIADIDAIDGDFMVHPFIIEALKSWIYWKVIQRDRNFGGGDKQLAKVDYEKAERIARIRLNSRNHTDWLMALRSGNKAAPKF
jgi:hypothetical protein